MAGAGPVLEWKSRSGATWPGTDRREAGARRCVGSELRRAAASPGAGPFSRMLLSTVTALHRRKLAVLSDHPEEMTQTSN